MKKLAAVLAAAALTLVGCANNDPLAGDTPAPRDTGATQSSGGTVKVGSANFPEAEIIAELYAQSLEGAGFTVERRMQIGARDVYVAAVKDGSIDLVPEYTGNLLQYFDTAAAAKTSDEVKDALTKATPSDFRVLAPAPAENKDSYVVTKEFAAEKNLKSLADLKSIGAFKLGGNPELAKRQYGPKGLESAYGVAAGDISFVQISDGGGPLTVKALLDGDVQVADIYSTTPAIAENGFVTLDDPENLIVAQNVVPLMSSRVTDAKVAETLDKVSAKLTTEELLKMNQQNQGAAKTSPKDVAAEWLKGQGLIG